MADEQMEPRLPFELAEMITDRGRGGAKLLRRLGEAFQPLGRFEGADRGQGREFGMVDHKYDLASTPNLRVVKARPVEQIKIRSFASCRRPHDPFLPLARPAPPDRNDDPRWRRRRVRRARVEPITLASRRRCASRRLAMARRQLGCLAPAADRKSTR